MRVKDHFLTGECFKLNHNDQYGFYETKPDMDYENLKGYYESKNYISHQEKTISIKSFFYNLVKQYMFSQKYKWIRKFVDNGTWLDFGAGTAEFLDYLPDEDWEKIAFEPSDNAIQKIKKKEIKYITNYKSLNEKLDVITAFHAIEHVVNIDDWFEFVKSNSKKDTIVAIAVPNYNSFDANYYKEYWAAYDVPRHQYHFSKQSIYKLFNAYGFSLIDEKPLMFDAYYISMMSEIYKGTNNLLKAMQIGFLSNQRAKRTKEYSSNLFILRRLEN